MKKLHHQDGNVEMTGSGSGEGPMGEQRSPLSLASQVLKDEGKEALMARLGRMEAMEISLATAIGNMMKMFEEMQREMGILR